MWVINTLMAIGMMVLCAIFWYVGYTVGKWDGSREAKK